MSAVQRWSATAVATGTGLVVFAAMLRDSPRGAAGDLVALSTAILVGALVGAGVAWFGDQP